MSVQIPVTSMLGSSYASDNGLDLVAREGVTLKPLGRALVKTGFACAQPERVVGMVCPRSGLALKHGVTVLNAPGIIDTGYRNEVGVILANISDEEYTVVPGDRVAQLVIIEQPDYELVLVDELPGAVDGRGMGGFGSSGR